MQQLEFSFSFQRPKKVQRKKTLIQCCRQRQKKRIFEEEKKKVLHRGFVSCCFVVLLVFLFVTRRHSDNAVVKGRKNVHKREQFFGDSKLDRWCNCVESSKQPV